jgi:5-methylcytosine-specific restriction enzyme A
MALSRPCIECGRPGRNARCASHGGKAWARPSRVGSDAYRGDWPKLRAAKLRVQPTCERCAAPATEVNHRIALADGGTHAASNLESICRDCHRRITAAQNRARRIEFFPALRQDGSRVPRRMRTGSEKPVQLSVMTDTQTERRQDART